MVTPPGGRAEGAPPNAVVPVRRAASVVVLADLPELHVLVATRRRGSVFVGGLIVFPGGALDPTDETPAARATIVGDAAADPAVAAFLHAAVRETLEETGLWLGGPGRAAAVAARTDIEAGRVTLAEVAGAGCIDAGGFAVAGHWVTPPGAPRRYDTRFFATRVSPERAADVSPDGTEVVAVRWWRPGELIEALAAGEVDAMEPTRAFICALARHDTAAGVLAAARAFEPPPRPGWVAF